MSVRARERNETRAAERKHGGDLIETVSFFPHSSFQIVLNMCVSL